MKFVLVAPSAAVLCSSCGTYNAGGRKQASTVIQNYSTVFLACDRELDDFTIHNAITQQLLSRSLSVVDKGSQKGIEGNGLVVRYNDSWSWDLVMFLQSLQIRVLDGKTSEVLATATFRQGKFFHSFPNSESTVEKLFAELDAKGVF